MIKIEEASKCRACNGCGCFEHNVSVSIGYNIGGHFQGHETVLCSVCVDTLIYLLGGATPEMLNEDGDAD